jgi:hypothetical protein
MSFFKYVIRVQTIHELIEKEQTGSSHEFAKKIGISRSVLMESLREMREDLGAPIDYCRRRETFYYSGPFTFSLVIASGLEKIKGGNNLPLIFFESDSTGLYSINFDYAKVNLLLPEVTEQRIIE